MLRSISMPTSQPNLPVRSRLLQPTASLLAKQNQHIGVHSRRVPGRYPFSNVLHSQNFVFKFSFCSFFFVPINPHFVSKTLLYVAAPSKHHFIFCLFYLFLLGFRSLEIQSTHLVKLMLPKDKS